jgi:imidazolonepropionase-like amidohydrolase
MVRSVQKLAGKVLIAGLLSATPLALPARPTASFPLAQPPAGPPFAIIGASLVDVERGVTVPNAVVVVKGDRIVASGPATSVSVPVGAKVIDLTGKWLAPGLINSHVHLGLRLPGLVGASLAGESDQAQTLRMAENARLSLQTGVTTLRLVGEENGNDFALKQAINARRVPGPRIETAGEIIVPTGGHGMLEVDGPAGFAQAVRSQIRDGASWIKIAISGGIADSHGDISSSPMSKEELGAAIEAAHRGGVKITAHNGSAAAAEEALALGIDGFEHGYHLTEAQLRKMKDKGVWLVPTIVVSQPAAQEFYKRNGMPDWYLARVDSTGKDHWAMLKAAIRIGVPIALGTDEFPYEVNQGTTATVREAELYVDAGMSPLQALRSATSEAARMLGLQADIGSLAPGHFADVIAMDADPLKGVSALRTIGFVMKGGEIVRSAATSP